MPSKIQLDENLWFLYICLTKSDLKTIDFLAVGAATNLKPPAARMRYTRLRRQIESGRLIGTHGTPFTGAHEKIAEASKKRKRNSQTYESVSPLTACCLPHQDQLKDQPQDQYQHQFQDQTPEQTIQLATGADSAVNIKQEDTGCETISEEDSEDEIPLAKLRKQRGGLLKDRLLQKHPMMMAQLFPMQPAFGPGTSLFGGGDLVEGSDSRNRRLEANDAREVQVKNEKGS